MQTESLAHMLTICGAGGGRGRKIRNEKERAPAVSGALSGSLCPCSVVTGQAVTAWPLVPEGDQGAAQRDQKKGSTSGTNTVDAAFSVAGGA